MGSVLALRSMAEETASFRQFRNSLVLVSLVVMVLALGLAYVAASRITGPVRRWSSSWSARATARTRARWPCHTRDEIGVLARTFNSLLADLREKEQMIGFLREGMTLLKRSAASTSPGTCGERRARSRPPSAPPRAGGACPPPG